MSSTLTNGDPAPTNEDQVRKLFLSFENQASDDDVETTLKLFTPDAVFHMWGPTEPPMIGHEAMRAGFQGLNTAVKWFRAELINIVSHGNMVFVERVEHMLYKEKHQVQLFIVGVGELDSYGKFTAWRDYFDPTELKNLMAAEA